MKNITKLVLVTILCSISMAISPFEWKVITSDQFSVYFTEKNKLQAYQVFDELNKNQKYVQQKTGNTNLKHLNVIVEDYGSHINGSTSFYKNKLVIEPYSPSSFEYLGYLHNWIKLVTIHELTHNFHFRNRGNLGQLMSNIFGFYFDANSYCPHWLSEGIAVYSESSYNKYSGRLNQGYYTEIANNQISNMKQIDIINFTYKKKYYPISNDYMLGSNFTKYLVETYGEETLTKFMTEQGKNPLGPFSLPFPAIGIDLAAKNSFGKDFPTLYQEWRQNILNKNLTKNTKPSLTKTKWTKKYLTFDNKNLYYYHEAPLDNAISNSNFKYNICKLNLKTNKISVIKSLISEPSTPFQVKEDTIYYSTKELKPGFSNITGDGYGYYNQLFKYDESTKTTTKIVENFRCFNVLSNGDIVFAQDNKDSFGSTIYLFNQEETIIIGKYSELISEILPYKDQFIIVSKKYNSDWDINILNPSKQTITSLINSPWSETNIKIKDEMLFYTNNPDHKVATFKYNLVNKINYLISDTTYAAEGFSINGDSYYIGITAEGEEIFKEKNKNKEVTIHAKNPMDYSIPTHQKIESKNAFLRNTAEILTPTNRFFPFLLTGGDILGYHDYTFNYGNTNGLKINYTLKLLSPLKLLINTKKLLNKPETEFGLSYPLYKSLNPGLTDITAEVITQYNGSTIPGITATSKQPNNVQKYALKYDISSKGYLVSIKESYYHDLATIQGAVYLLNNFEYDLSRHGKLYQNTYNAKDAIFNISINNKLIEFGFGLWNPGIYVKNLYGSLFWDWSAETEYSAAGYEISTKIITAYRAIQFQPRLGIDLINNLWFLDLSIDLF